MACFRARQTDDTDWVTRACAYCGGDFRVRGKEARKRAASYCSRECHRATIARTSRVCARCGAEFHPKSPNSPEGTLRGLFCSKTCSGLAQRTRVTRKCAQCAGEFEVKASRVESGRGRYCGKECHLRAEARVERSCQGCGKVFEVVRNVAKRGWGQFCSQACTARRVERTCRMCGTEFTIKQSVADDGRGAYCSNACRHLGKRDQMSKSCEGCGMEFSVPRSLVKRRTCSRTCWTKIMGADPVRSAILARARHDQLTTRAETRPERILYALIDEVTTELAPDIAWERQHPLLGRWTVDAAIPSLNLVLQADGDYWHGLLPEYREDPRVIGNMANDARQDRALTEAGGTVLRFWEHDLIGDLPTCTERLRAAVLQKAHAAEPSQEIGARAPSGDSRA